MSSCILWCHSNAVKHADTNEKTKWSLTYFSITNIQYIVKPVLSRHSKKDQERLSLNAGQKYCRRLSSGRKYCRMLQESILQYFWPALNYHLSSTPLFCLMTMMMIMIIVVMAMMMMMMMMMIFICLCSSISSSWCHWLVYNLWMRPFLVIFNCFLAMHWKRENLQCW